MTTYSIDQFSEITGLSKYILRTWENRYDFLSPDRTKTKIRIYNDHMVIRALNTSYLLKNGYKISKVAKLSDSHLSHLIYNIKNNDSSTKQSFYIHEMITSALQFDSEKFNATYKEGVAELGILSFYKEVVLNTLHKIGILWQTDRIAPSQEHFLSEHIKQKIAVESEKNSDKKNSKKNWLLFLLENEFHEIGLLFAKYLLIEKGDNVIYLGQNVSNQSLIDVTKKVKIDHTLLFSTSNSSKKHIGNTLTFLASNLKDINHVIVSNEVDQSNISDQKNINVINELADFIDLYL